MKTFTVYRVDSTSKVTEPVGMVWESREEEGKNGIESLLLRAQKKYCKSSKDSRIYILPA